MRTPSPLSASLSHSPGAPPHGTAPWFSHPADHRRLETPERGERETLWCHLEIPLLILPLRPAARPRQRKMARVGTETKPRERERQSDAGEIRSHSRDCLINRQKKKIKERINTREKMKNYLDEKDTLCLFIMREKEYCVLITHSFSFFVYISFSKGH